MKHFFTSVRKITKPLKTNLLDPNPNTLSKLIPDKKTIKGKSNSDFEQYIDGIFKENPHLSEKEMFEIYHTHKPVFDKEVAKRTTNIEYSGIVTKLNELKNKVNESKSDSDLQKNFDKFLKEYSKLNKVM